MSGDPVQIRVHALAEEGPGRSSRMWRSCCTMVAALTLLACDMATDEPSSVPSEPHAECPGATALDGLWTPAHREEIAASLDEQPGDWPQQLLATLEHRVEVGRAEWRDDYLDACRRGDPRARRCLDEQAWTLDAVGSLLADEGVNRAALWPALVGVLPPGGDRCVLWSGTGPGDAGLSAALGRRLASLTILVEIGETERARAELAELRADPSLAEHPHYALLVAEAELALTLAGSEPAPDEAAAQLGAIRSLAKELGPGGELVLARSEAVEALALGRVDEGFAALSRALAAARELPGSSWALTQLLALGRASLEHGRPQQAAASLTEAIALATREHGESTPWAATAQIVLARSLIAKGSLEAAHDLLIQARDSYAMALGPDHPQTLEAIADLGRVLMLAHQPGDAHHAFLDLLEINRELYGPKHWRTAAAKLELAETLLLMEQFDGARQLYTEALPPLTQELGADSRPVVRAAIHLGLALLALGQLEDAAKMCERGRGLTKALAKDDPLIEEVEDCLAELETLQAK